MPNIRHNWTPEQATALFEMPFNDLIFQAQTVHREHFNPAEVQISTLLSIKTGACPEDCSYCPQSGHYKTGVEKERLIELENIMQNAKVAKEKGASRFCMGAAWRSIPKRELGNIVEIVKKVKALGMETCMTLGMLDEMQAKALKDAGLDYYNHNLDTSPEYYKEIISTRCYQDRLDTLQHVRDAGIKVCCGGIVGLGESRADRIEFLRQLATLPAHPESVPINRLIAVKGTPLQDQKPINQYLAVCFLDNALTKGRAHLPNHNKLSQQYTIPFQC